MTPCFCDAVFGTLQEGGVMESGERGNIQSKKNILYYIVFHFWLVWVHSAFIYVLYVLNEMGFTASYD